MMDIGTLGGLQSFAYGVNNSSEVVGGADLPNGIEHAFLFSEGTLQDLTPGLLLSSRAYAINNRHKIVGYITSGEQHAFIFQNGTNTDLNDVIDPNSGWLLEVATGINEKGQIVGVGTHPVYTLRAFLLTPVLWVQITSRSGSVSIQFTGQPNVGYMIEYRNSLSTGTWQTLVVLDPLGVEHQVVFNDTLVAGRQARFYRVRAI